MPSPRAFSSEIKIRIRNVDTMENIKKIYSSKQFKSINDIVNAALERGLPLLMERGTPIVNVEDLSDRLLEHLEPLTNSLILNMKKITVLQTVQEAMLGSILHELEFFLKIQGVEIDPTLLDEFKLYLPERFEQDKQELIERLFDTAEPRNEDDINE